MKKITPTDQQMIVLISAYGEEYNKLKKFINYNGWCRVDHNLYKDIDKEFCRTKPAWWRPVKLKGFLGRPF
jgi:hypothetical protein